MKKWTFDIFDTLVTRAVPAPVQVFDLLEMQVGDQLNIPVGLASARKACEVMARQDLAKGEDTTLECIYAKMAEQYALSRSDVVSLIEKEIELEYELSRPHQEGMDLLKQARDEHAFLGYISDMYLPQDAVVRLLQKHDIWNNGDKLWISSVEKKTKSSGLLFEEVEKQAGVARDSWIHVGDNVRSDINVPMQMGITSVAVSKPLTEKRSQELRGRNPYDTLLARGAVTVARRHAYAGEVDDDKVGIWDLASDIGGPLVYWLVNRVIEEAIKEGKTDLWFLARDGQVMWRIAKRIVAHKGIQLGVHYVAASRQAVHMPALRSFGDSERKWIFSYVDQLTVDDLVARLHLEGETAEIFRDAIAGEGVPLEGDIASWIDQIWTVMQSAQLSGIILDRAKELRQEAVRYFCQFDGGGNIGIVDIGWGGNLQASLQSILQDEPVSDSLKGWYLGLWMINEQVDPSRVRALLFGPDDNKLQQWKRMIPLFELFFSGTHPGIHGYVEREDGSVDGMYASEESWSAQKSWGIQELQDAIVHSASELLKENVELAEESVRQVVYQFGMSPTKEETEVLASWPCQSEQNTSSSQPFLPRYSLGDMIWALRGTINKRLHWREGTLCLNGVMRYGAYSVARKIGLAVFSRH